MNVDRPILDAAVAEVDPALGSEPTTCADSLAEAGRDTPGLSLLACAALTSAVSSPSGR